jgi:hypothetical protein
MLRIFLSYESFRDNQSVKFGFKSTNKMKDTTNLEKEAKFSIRIRDLGT